MYKRLENTDVNCLERLRRQNTGLDSNPELPNMKQSECTQHSNAWESKEKSQKILTHCPSSSSPNDEDNNDNDDNNNNNNNNKLIRLGQT